MKYETCSQCGKFVNEEKILNLNVINSWTSIEVNEPEFLLCHGCWRKLKEKLEKLENRFLGDGE